ncbi:MAG: ATP-dependent zinc metalloprotease FtsH [Vampirovibrionales bacterium]|nr:ATP-dependent zinc metalloprotease FtsH [Vampirovibrionales bacterium]
MKKHQTTGVLILSILVLAVLFVTTVMIQQSATLVTEIPYSSLLKKIEAGQISKLVIQDNFAHATPAAPKADPAEAAAENRSEAPQSGALTPPALSTDDANKTTDTAAQATGLTPPAAESQKDATLQNESGTTLTKVPDTLPRRYKTVLPEKGLPESVLQLLDKQGVTVTFEEPESSGRWWGMLWSLFLLLSFILLIVAIYRGAQSGGAQALAFGKSRAKLSSDKVKVTFKDVAGIDEAKAELEEVVDFLKNSERYHKLGARIPKGVLLVGSPGTGKTLLAKAVAGEAGVPFFSISGSDFVEMFVGVGASRVRDLFEQAKKQAPCILFVDEIDAVGRQRGAGMGGGHDEREQTLNQLLVEMDGFDPTAGIIVLAATNRPDILDNALLRPGRFDRQVVIDRPDVVGREQILKVHAKGKPFAPDVDLKTLAKRTPGFTGADLSNLLNEGALLAARYNKDIIEMADIEASIDKVIAGVEKKGKVIKEKEREITAYHEVGHALVAILTPGCDPLRKVTIIPRGMALGLTWTMPDDEQVHVSKSQLLSTISMTLGGRAAEELIYGEMYTGASDDLQKVTRLARRLVTVYGMSEKLGPLTFGKRNEHVFMGRDFGHERDYGEAVAEAIDAEVRQIVDERYVYAKKLLSDNRDIMDAIVKTLLEKESLDDRDVQEIIDRVRGQRASKEAVVNV